MSPVRDTLLRVVKDVEFGRGNLFQPAEIAVARVLDLLVQAGNVLQKVQRHVRVHIYIAKILQFQSFS